MKIVPFDVELADSTIFYTSSPDIDPRKYGGEDSMVLKNIVTLQAIHVYSSRHDFEDILIYANSMDKIGQVLEDRPYEETVVFEGSEYKVRVHGNSIDEVGEKYFDFGGMVERRVYTYGNFIEGDSLCWAHQAQSDELRAVAICIDVRFYDRLENHLYENTGMLGIDINPVNVKYKIDREERTIDLTITDIAKSIANIYIEQKR